VPAIVEMLLGASTPVEVVAANYAAAESW